MNVDIAWLSAEFKELSKLKPLNDGGQKIVFSATHSSEGDVVLKLIQPGQDLERVRREIEAVRLVQSPRVPVIHAFGSVQSQIGNLIWIREQRIMGTSLRDLIKLQGALGPELILRVGRDVLEALSAAETVRIVHRDVKPDNVVVDSQGGAWLLDFGIARHLDLHSVTASALPWGVGTLGYAPSEQLRNAKRDIDARADLFGLGVTLYECATGLNPFREGARDGLEIMTRIERQPLPRLNAAWDSGGLFADFVSTLAQTHRDHRPVNAADALAWIGEICRAHRI